MDNDMKIQGQQAQQKKPRKIANIPVDYDGEMGVTVSYLMKHNPDQFEIVGTTENGLCDKALWINPEEKHNEPFIDGKKKYTRILIKRRASGRKRRKRKCLTIVIFIVLKKQKTMNFSRSFQIQKTN